MPYIKQEQRKRFKRIVKELYLGDSHPRNCGELNYLFTEIIRSYLLEGSEFGTYQKSYQKFNDIVGALECCKLELVRRQIGTYEDKKILENGDVY